MLTRLLKYDLKYMIKNMSVFYILALFFSILSRILFELKGSVITDIISGISVGCMFSMLGSILINTMMRSWVRFNDSIYKDESYLTHTLPVSKNDIYNSKFIQALIVFIVGFAVILLSLFISYYTKERWQSLISLVNGLSKGLDTNTTILIISMIAVIFLEIFNAIQCGFFGLIAGHKKNNRKMIYSVVFGFIAYLFSQNMVLFLTFIFGLFNSDIMALFKNDTVINPTSLKLLMFLAIILYLVIIFVMSVICKKEFNKGVDVE